MRNAMREDAINRKSLIRMVTDFIKNLLPTNTTQATATSPSLHSSNPTSHVSPSQLSFDPPQHEAVYETPSSSRNTGVADDDDDNEENDANETEVREFGTIHFGKVASPYVTSYIYNKSSLDKDFGIRRDDDGQFRIGRSLIEVDGNSNVYVDGKSYEGTSGLFELLTRKKVNKSLITTRDLKNYRRILETTSAHLENNNPVGPIKTTRGVKFREVISHLFPASNKRGVETALRRAWIRYK
jgi:hypothetical protein